MTDALHAEISHTGCFRVQRIYTVSRQPVRCRHTATKRVTRYGTAKNQV